MQTAPTKITRHTINSWESDIGYAAVAQTGNTYHISGVTCGGANYQEAVSVCYKELGGILARYQLTSQNVIKENIYALDIEALQQQIPERKTFYVNGQFPAATWVQVSRLYSPEHLIEIELIAVK
ncbi:RidA family protein [Cellvibrio fibrivorans]|uniref:Enamine deaminase RidA (YjgF/YER057c/UK114 family) n=1 Tax=Cellvibrio fibrivorans TaxID=126350 RepID=A0ABU1UZ06_9GAMM|nr:RidA family protein [Cellvibrio fibrivorans]MDR7090421.1 enamine deaminase RidA (YjgF/YER057c/UK114 family) [Cellvibrio fibrivorans]